jgi:antitoxin ParD1/3/4/toxin ParE1/3/4
MKTFALTRAAERDLDQIKDFLVEKAGPTITRRVLKEIRQTMTLIGANPGVGHVREDLTDSAAEVLANLLLSDRLRPG